MVQGSWDGVTLNVSFSCSSFCFLVCSSFPIRASFGWTGVDDFTLCPDPVFLRSLLLVFFLGAVACRPCGGGMKFLSDGVSLNVSFSCSSFCFLVCSSFPIRASFGWTGVDDFTHCLDLVFLHSFLLVFFLGVVACWPCGGGMKCIPNK